jgi:alkylhydroperoxidase family enzyme
VADVWTPLERAVLAWTDGLIQDRGRVADGVFEALSALMSDEDILELTYHVCGYNTHAVMCRALRLEYDDVPERVEEVPMPDGPGVQDWAGRAWSKPA